MYSMIMLKNKFISFLLFAIVTYSASFIGSIATISYKEPWYSNLNKSFLTPPDWVFAPVWTTLYFLMSFAIWKVWIKSFETKLLKIYFTHLFFNSTWSVVFFGFHLIGIALVNLVIILIFIIILMKEYFFRDKISFYLMIPYLAWSSYALILNTSIFLLN